MEHKMAWSLMVLALFFTQNGLICGGSLIGTPPFSIPDTEYTTDNDVQIIIPQYQFNCSGVLTSWGACVAAMTTPIDYILRFQVWRRSEANYNCYSLVGEIAYQPGPDSTRSSRCFTMDVRAEDQVAVQEGDVVGIYVGIPGESDDSEGITSFGLAVEYRGGFEKVPIYYRSVIFTSYLRMSYAVGVTPQKCGFPQSTYYMLNQFMFGAPVIIATVEPYESELPLPTTTTITTQEARPTGLPRPYSVNNVPLAPSVDKIPLASTPAVTPPIVLENPQSSTSNSRTAVFVSSLVFLGVGIACSIAAVVVVAILLRRRKLKKNQGPKQSNASSEETLNESLEYNYAYSGRSNQSSSLQTSQKNP